MTATEEYYKKIYFNLKYKFILCFFENNLTVNFFVKIISKISFRYYVSLLCLKISKISFRYYVSSKRI